MKNSTKFKNTKINECDNYFLALVTGDQGYADFTEKKQPLTIDELLKWLDKPVDTKWICKDVVFFDIVDDSIGLDGYGRILDITDDIITYSNLWGRRVRKTDIATFTNFAVEAFIEPYNIYELVKLLNTTVVNFKTNFVYTITAINFSIDGTKLSLKSISPLSSISFTVTDKELAEKYTNGIDSPCGNPKHYKD